MAPTQVVFGIGTQAPVEQEALYLPRFVAVPLRILSAFGASLVLGAVLSIGVVLALPYVTNGRAFTVMSGSMEPTLRVGDVVVDERISPFQARIGDIVTFTDPNGSGKLYTHRVRRITIGRGYANFTTKGDANNDVEHWSVALNGSIGRVRYDLPRIGYALFYVRSSYGKLLLLLLPASIGGFVVLRRIWR
jgi:signal peptidase I